MNILGVSAFYHDSAAALVRDGEIAAAAQEERFTRVKHDERFPEHAIASCLQLGGLAARDLDYVVFYEKPLLKFDRMLETFLAHAPRGLDAFLTALPSWLKQKLHTPREIRKKLGPDFRGRILYAGHHESHAASAFFPSPFTEAAIVTLDGVGEWETTTIGVGRGNRLELKQRLEFPHSLGLLYSAFTYFCGFKVNSGEYKLMGLAPYGEPRFADTIRRELLDLKDDGSFAMDLGFFDYCVGMTMTNDRFARLFGGPPRRPEDRLTQRERDLAASVQKVTEEIILRIARQAVAVTGLRRVCLAGGVALNCVANGQLLRSGIVDDLWVQPAAGDAGGALGAALLGHFQLLDNPRRPPPDDAMRGALLGPAYTNDEIRAALEREKVPFHFHADETDLLERVARELAAGKVAGWFQGRMEYGPRALGSRSILGDPRNAEMQVAMNVRIKFRESFRPFAPAVLRECVGEYFAHDGPSPYMLVVAPVRESQRTPLDEAQQAALRSDDLCERVRVARSTLPAVTHVDYSARLQTVDERNGRFHRLLREFRRQTGCGVVVNTSFNIRGEPIVCRPEEAVRCFLGTDMDLLVLENFILYKSEQKALDESGRAAYVKGFKLD